MAFDIAVTIGAVDEGFSSGIDRANAKANTMFGGMLKTGKQLRESVVGIAGLFASGFGFGLVIDQLRSFSEHQAEVQAEIVRKAAEELETRRKLTDEIGKALVELQRMAAADPLGSKFDDIESKGQAALDKAQELYELDAKAPSRLVGGGWAEAFVKRQETSAKVREAVQAAKDAARDELATRAQQAEVESRIAEYRALGQQGIADEMQAALDHEKRLAEIKKDSASADLAMVERRIEAENRRFDAERAKLGEADRLRKLAEADQKRRDRDQADSAALKNDLLELGQRAEAARLSGNERAAKALELEIDHRRRLYDIERAEGLEGVERSRRSMEEDRLFGMRVAALDAGKSGGFGAGATGLLSGDAARINLGGGSVLATAVSKQTAIQQQQLQELQKMRRFIETRPGGTAVLA